MTDTEFISELYEWNLNRRYFRAAYIHVKINHTRYEI